VLFLWVRALRLPLSSTQRAAFHGLAAVAILQATLGIKTLLMFVPVSLGAAHQGGAVILLSAVLFALYESGRAPEPVGAAESVRVGAGAA
jgi:heme a synthase